MTRINVVPPEELCRQHLVAEYRELPRVFSLARKAGCRAPSSSHYTLGAGHVRFFYDKLGWLLERQKALIAEMQRRGYAPQHTEPERLVEGLPLGVWEPTPEAIAINRARIAERMPK